MTNNNPTEMAYEEDSIDIIAILKTVWDGRKLLVKSILAFSIIGCIIALSSPVIYTSQTTFVPQTSDNQSSSAPKGLGSLAGLVGIDLSSMGSSSSDSYLSPLLYTKIAESGVNIENIDFSKSVFILPNKRSGYHLKKTLSKVVSKTIFSPKIVSIENFIEELSELKLLSNTELIFEFYSIYLNITPKDKQEKFEDFIKWSRILIQDFNIIDKEIIQTVHHLIFMKANIFEFINSYLREFLNNEKYLAVFSSLKNLKDRIDKKVIVYIAHSRVECKN